MEKYITSSDEVVIHYDINLTTNCQKWIVLVHGLGGDLTAWKEVVCRLKVNTIAIDLRGHGGSGRPRNAQKYSFKRMAQDIDEILCEEKIDKPIVVGHCLGGMVTMVYASTYKNIESAILVATNYKAPWYGRVAAKVKFPKIIFNLASSYLPLFYSKNRPNYQKYTKTGDYYIPRIASDIWHTSLVSYLGICKHMTGDLDLTPLLKKIKCRTLVIYGEKDVVFPKKLSFELAKKIKKCQIKGIDGGHVLVVSNPKELSDEINGWIGE